MHAQTNHLFRLIFSKLIFLFIILGCTSSHQHEGKIAKKADVKKFLLSLSSEEHFLLDFFFRCMIQEDAIGQVFLGGKPMSFYSSMKPKTIINSSRIQPLDRMELFFYGMDDRHALFHKGLEVWKKYEHRFCGNNIFFDVFEQDQELHFIQVSVFNKQLMVPLFDHYFHQFKNLSPSIKDNESLFNLLMHDQKFKEKFYSREDLLGICLGYGEKNAKLFQKMVDLLTDTKKIDLTLKKLSPERFRSLENELAVLEKSFSGGIKDHVSRRFLFNIGLSFRTNPSDPETLLLQKKYATLYKQLVHAYTGAPFLEKTLELIYTADNIDSN